MGIGQRGPLELLCAALTGFAIVVGVVLLVVVSRQREFQVDEVEHLHAAYNIRDGRMIYRDFWQGHPPLLYALLTPLTDVHNPVATYRRARILTVTLLLATIALCSLAARRLGGGWAAALAFALALFHTTLIERGIEVRPDGALALLIIGALAIELSWHGPLRRFSVEALLLGLGGLLTQKAVLPLAIFAMMWIAAAVRERRPRLIIQPLLLSLVPLAIALAVLAAMGTAAAFLRDVVFSATSAVTRSENRGTFSPLGFLIVEQSRNVAFALLAIAGLIWIALRRRDNAARFTAFVALAGVVALWASPFPWPYVQVGIIPPLVVVAATFVACASGRRAPVAVVAVIALAGVTAVPRLMRKGAGSPDLQFATLREIARLTAPNATAFDLAGLYFRPDAYPVYAMSGDMLLSYVHGAFPRIVPELHRNAVACVLYDYRTSALPAEEKAFIGSHFTHYGGNIYLPGADLTRAASIEFEVLAPARFRYEGRGAIAVDGTPFTRGLLTRGVHHISTIRPATPSRIVIDAPPPALTGPPSLSLFPTFD